MIQKVDSGPTTVGLRALSAPFLPMWCLVITIATHVAVCTIHAFASLGSEDLTETPLHTFVPRIRFFLSNHTLSEGADTSLTVRYVVFIGNALTASFMVILITLVLLRQKYDGDEVIVPGFRVRLVLFRLSDAVRLLRILAVVGGMFGVMMALIILFGMTNACVPRPCYGPNMTTVSGVAVIENNTCAPCSSNMKTVQHLQDQHQIKYPFPMSVCPSDTVQTKLKGKVSLCSAFPTEQNPIMCGERYCHISDAAVTQTDGQNKFFIGFPMDSWESYESCVRLPGLERKGLIYGVLRLAFYVFQFIIFGQALTKKTRPQSNSRSDADANLEKTAIKPLWMRITPRVLGVRLTLKNVYLTCLAVIWSIFAYSLVFNGTVQL